MWKVEGGKERRWEGKRVRRWEKAGLSNEDYAMRAKSTRMWKVKGSRLKVQGFRFQNSFFRLPHSDFRIQKVCHLFSVNRYKNVDFLPGLALSESKY